MTEQKKNNKTTGSSCEHFSPIELTQDMFIPSPPGDFLRDALADHQLKHKDFAEAIGIGKADLSNLIHGRRRFSPTLAALIAKALGTSSSLWLNLQAMRDDRCAKHDKDIQQRVSAVQQLVYS